jgi:dihydrodipicolinate synthase/N-acetylneuraminate lyase
MTYTPPKGLNVPTVTVLDEAGRVLADEQRQVFRHVIQQGYGADMIFGVGTTGEWNRLANSERQRVMEIEIDEVQRVNAELRALGRKPIEAWVGINGRTRAETLANLDAAIQMGADAAVIAPLAIEDLDEREIVRFFHRDLANLIEASRREIPVFLYDNADISAPGHAPHIRTRLIKHLSRLPWLVGIKVSAPRRVLGNYTKAALHFKQRGEFGIYIGDAMLIFELYRPTRGLIGRLRVGWNTYLLHHSLPIGVVSGPANVLPREWQKAWRVCWAGDEELTDLYQDLCARFDAICAFEEDGRRVKKTIACLKYALELDGVISSSTVGHGTKSLTEAQKEIFGEKYCALRERVRREVEPLWQTVPIESRLRSAR